MAPSTTRAGVRHERTRASAAARPLPTPAAPRPAIAPPTSARPSTREAGGQPQALEPGHEDSPQHAGRSPRERPSRRRRGPARPHQAQRLAQAQARQGAPRGRSRDRAQKGHVAGPRHVPAAVPQVGPRRRVPRGAVDPPKRLGGAQPVQLLRRLPPDVVGGRRVENAAEGRREGILRGDDGGIPVLGRGGAGPLPLRSSSSVTGQTNWYPCRETVRMKVPPPPSSPSARRSVRTAWVRAPSETTTSDQTRSKISWRRRASSRRSTRSRRRSK